jgi:hypothetical protein
MPTISYSSPTVSGTVQVNSEMAIPKPSSSQTIFNYSGTINSATTVHTVTAGKTAYVMAIMGKNSGAVDLTLEDEDESTDIAVIRCNNGTAILQPGCPIHSYSAGSNIVVTPGATITCSVIGYEE